MAIKFIESVVLASRYIDTSLSQEEALNGLQRLKTVAETVYEESIPDSVLEFAKVLILPEPIQSP